MGLRSHDTSHGPVSVCKHNRIYHLLWTWEKQIARSCRDLEQQENLVFLLAGRACWDKNLGDQEKLGHVHQ